MDAHMSESLSLDPGLAVAVVWEPVNSALLRATQIILTDVIAVWKFAAVERGDSVTI